MMYFFKNIFLLYKFPDSTKRPKDVLKTSKGL